jgi:hypothetical protein
MLKSLVILLLLANGAYLAWSQGLLRDYGFAPTEQGEPQRLEQQLHPEAIRLVKADEAKRVETAAVAAAVAAARPTECLQAAGFDEEQTLVLRRALEASLPPGAWTLDAVLEPPHWIVYMGKYPNRQALAAKQTELAALNLKIEALKSSALEPGFSLGGYDSQANADAALLALSRRGVRTAKVVQEVPDTKAWALKIPAADEPVRSRLDDLRNALAGKALRSCK